MRNFFKEKKKVGHTLLVFVLFYKLIFANKCKMSRKSEQNTKENIFSQKFLFARNPNQYAYT